MGFESMKAKSLPTFNIYIAIPMMNIGIKKSIKFPKTKKIGKELVSLSPKDYVEGTKTAARALDSMIPGREEAYLKRKKGGPIRKNKGGPIDARKIAKKYFKGTF